MNDMDRRLIALFFREIPRLLAVLDSVRSIPQPKCVDRYRNSPYRADASASGLIAKPDVAGPGQLDQIPHAVRTGFEANVKFAVARL